jgi:Protein of unknown function (DUF3592)
MSRGLIDNVLHHDWREVEAEVTDCKFVRAVRSRTGGEPAYYLVSFTYQVNGTTYYGGLRSTVEVMRGDKFSVLYNPERAEENNSMASECERWWFKDYIYVVGAVILGLIVFDIVRSLFFR